MVLQVLRAADVPSHHVSYATALSPKPVRRQDWLTVCRVRHPMQIYVKAVMLYSVLGFLVFEIFFFGVWCRPFANYFAVIDNNTGRFTFFSSNCLLRSADTSKEGCTTAQRHLMMSFVFNLSSDLLILVIPFKMFVKSSLPLKK